MMHYNNLLRSFIIFSTLTSGTLSYAVTIDPDSGLEDEDIKVKRVQLAELKAKNTALEEKILEKQALDEEIRRETERFNTLNMVTTSTPTTVEAKAIETVASVSTLAAEKTAAELAAEAEEQERLAGKSQFVTERNEVEDQITTFTNETLPRETQRIADQTANLGKSVEKGIGKLFGRR